MKLSKILEGIDVLSIRGAKEIEITGISNNSKLVSPGNLFIAKRGRQYDGAHFIPEAARAGAKAVITEIFDPFVKLPQVIVENVNRIESRIAANYYCFPARELFMVGITGTNGKTTTSYILKHILDAVKRDSGLLGTVEYVLGKTKIRAERTTLNTVLNQRYLREMVNNGMKSAVMEVTSHALDQNRVEFIDYDAAIFTNLAQDHLDYHETIQNYLHAKAKLFSSLGKESTAVVNGDDPAVEELVKNCTAKVLTYGMDEKNHLRAEDIEFDRSGSQFTLLYEGRKILFASRLIGRFNVYNALAAIGVALTSGVPLESLPEIISSFVPVNGRLEQVECKENFSIFIDFAHTESALKNVLLALREIKKGRIITVFGCGGERDRGKRAKMGRVCEEYSDLSVVTSDNPRGEEPMAIIEEIVLGFRDPGRLIIEEDRFKAISKAISLARENDVVLVAGRGHECQQIFKNRTVPFDDRMVVKEILQLSNTSSLGRSV